MKKNFIILFLSLFLFSCSEQETIEKKNDYNPKKWDCIIDDTLMYSKMKDGFELGGAQKGCSCDKIEAFEIKTFGKVNYENLKTDFGCEIPLKSRLNTLNEKKDNETEKLTQKECFKLSNNFRLKENESIDEVLYSKKENSCFIVTRTIWKDEEGLYNSTTFLYDMLKVKYMGSYVSYDIYNSNYTKGFDKDLFKEIYVPLKE